MYTEITLCTYVAPAINKPACAVYKPQYHWQDRFAPRFDDMGECRVLKQTALERMKECILTHYPDCKINVVECAPWN